MPYPRVPTEQEWDRLHEAFPNLQRDDVQVEGPASSTYNCIAWALGYTDRWINPPHDREAFVDLFLQQQHPRHYAHRLPARAQEATSDGCESLREMTHASRCEENTWSSKLGGYLRISHNRLGVEGQVYGGVTVSSS